MWSLDIKSQHGGFGNEQGLQLLLDRVVVNKVLGNYLQLLWPPDSFQSKSARGFWLAMRFNTACHNVPLLVHLESYGYVIGKVTQLTSFFLGRALHSVDKEKPPVVVVVVVSED